MCAAQTDSDAVDAALPESLPTVVTTPSSPYKFKPVQLSVPGLLIGIGILSVQAAYWLYPIIAKTFFHQRYLANPYISPYVSSQSKGLSCTVTF